jgi:hypothetical protein
MISNNTEGFEVDTSKLIWNYDVTVVPPTTGWYAVVDQDDNTFVAMYDASAGRWDGALPLHWADLRSALVVPTELAGAA